MGDMMMNSTALTGLLPRPGRVRALQAEVTPPTIGDVVNLQKEAQNLFADFREANDERLAQIEAKGAADAVTVGKVEALNAEMTTQLDAMSETVTALNLSVGRLTVGGPAGGGGDDVQAQARKFFASMEAARGNKRRPSEIDAMVDVQVYQDYAAAFNEAMFHGMNDKALGADFRNALSVGADPSGGYMVPPEQSTEFETRIFETSPMRQVATARTIGVDAWEQPKDVDEGISGGWVSEMQARPATGTPTVGVQRIDVHEQYAFPQLTQKMLEDAVLLNPSAWLESKTTDKMIRDENAAFVTGDGSGKPRGFLSYGADATTADDKTGRPWGTLQYVPSGAAGAFAATDPADPLIDLVHSLKGTFRAGASWMMGRLTMAEVRKLKDGQGNYLWSMGDIQRGQPTTLAGFGITEAEDLPAIAADSFSLAFGNWSVGYTIIDRLGLFVLVDPLTNKPFVGFYIRKRVGGDVTNFDAIKLFKFAAS